MIANLTGSELRKLGLDNKQISEIRFILAVKGSHHAVKKTRVFIALNKSK